jgi:hypothetical protein
MIIIERIVRTGDCDKQMFVDEEEALIWERSLSFWCRFSRPNESAAALGLADSLSANLAGRGFTRLSTRT